MNKDQAQGVKWPKYLPWLFFALSSLAGLSASCLPPHPSWAQGVMVPSPPPLPRPRLLQALRGRAVASKLPPHPTGCLLPSRRSRTLSLPPAQERAAWSHSEPSDTLPSAARLGVTGQLGTRGKGGQYNGGGSRPGDSKGAPAKGSRSESQGLHQGGFLQSSACGGLWNPAPLDLTPGAVTSRLFDLRLHFCLPRLHFITSKSVSDSPVPSLLRGELYIEYCGLKGEF